MSSKKASSLFRKNNASWSKHSQNHTADAPQGNHRDPTGKRPRLPSSDLVFRWNYFGRKQCRGQYLMNVSQVRRAGDLFRRLNECDHDVLQKLDFNCVNAARRVWPNHATSRATIHRQRNPCRLRPNGARNRASSPVDPPAPDAPAAAPSDFHKPKPKA